ncbi:hypothetical protein GCM10009665_21710 [Kitasatospora nipponensis]|uniref:Uncharacterized protein n=1 Tax=Kitasatospora nipponensis TaxID=258049 RepID=A0ABP4GPY5_9ACTN
MTRSHHRPTPPSVPPPPGRRLGSADQVVLIVILVLASVLTVAKVPTTTVLELLAGEVGMAMGLLQRRPARRGTTRCRRR